MFEKIRRSLSGEPKPAEAKVTRIDDRAHERRMNAILHPNLNPKLQRTLSGQNDDNFFAYQDALSEQRGEHTGADGGLVYLELINPETGEVPSDSEIDDDEPKPNPPLPPPPISAA